MAAQGYIYLHRKITENPIWECDQPFDKRSAFIDVLLMANYSDKEIVIGSEVVKIKRGQFITSQLKLAARWHWTEKRVRRYLNLLKSLEIIQYDATKKYTLVTVLKYAEYQASRGFRGEQMTEQMTEQKPNERPNKRRTDDLQLINNKEIINKEEIKERKEPAPPFGGGEWQ